MKKINKIFLLCTLLLSFFLLSCGKEEVHAEFMDPMEIESLEGSIEQFFTGIVSQDEESLENSIEGLCFQGRGTV